jgi:hypothetical protein
MSKQVTCRWCSWHRPVWSTAKGGALRDGWEALRDHVEQEHPAEFQAIQAHLAGESPALPSSCTEAA